MKTERVIWGLIFLFIGGVLLLNNFNLINFHWDIVWRFWPLILIVIGANMLFSRGDAGRSGVLAIVITIAALGFIGYQGTSGAGYQSDRSSGFDDGDDGDDEPGSKTDTSFVEPLNAALPNAELNISGGATAYKLQDTTSELFKANVKSSFGNYSLFKITKDSTEVLNFKMSGKKKWDSLHDGDKNRADIKLSTKPIWDINFEVGAGKIDFDLSAFKVRNLRFEGGAASVELKLGQPLLLSKITAETGVSEIKISIPKNAACQIKVDSGLSSNNFDGFSKKDDNTFETENFAAAKDKFVIDLEGGLSSFHVDRY